MLKYKINWNKNTLSTFYALSCIIIYVISARTCFLRGRFNAYSVRRHVRMLAPATVRRHKCLPPLSHRVTNYIRRKISRGGKALVRRRSRKEVGMIEKGEGWEGQKRGAVKRGWSFTAQCVRIAEEVGKTADSLARARFFFPLSLSRLLNQATRRGLKKI